jgi:hypothetical protein
MPHDEESKPTTTTVYSQSNCPDIKYWTKKEWTEAQSAKKNSSDPTDQPGARGKSRCAQGVNVSAKYLEEHNGMPVTGTKAAKIREYARSIWIDFDARGVAPRKWSHAPRSVQDEYVRDMENQWPILQYCEDHWKVHHLATNSYPQWYKSHHVSKKVDNTETKGPAQKRRKVEDDDTGDRASEADSETNTDPDASDSDADNNIASPSWLEEGIREESTSGPSRPKARPLRDPLYVLKYFVDVANNPRSSF